MGIKTHTHSLQCLAPYERQSNDAQITETVKSNSLKPGTNASTPFPQETIHWLG